MGGSLLFAAVFLLAFAGVPAFRKWSLQKGLLDCPNERSSHKIPTPRGGGVIVVLLCLIFYSVISYFYPGTFSWGYLLGGALVAVVSWLDDVYSLWFLLRLAAHSVGAAVLIISSGIDTLGITWSLISLFWVVGLINAYNFMDGIDGIAGVQSVIAAASWLALGFVFEMPVIYYFGGVIAASSLGFLIHNWQPAKIFMGDVGSAFLGFTFAALPLIAAKQTDRPTYLLALAGMIFLWFFLFDSIVTFIRRLIRGKNIFTAHREHIYQKLVLSGMSHGKVATIYGFFASVLSISTIASLVFFYEAEMVVLFVTPLLTAGFLALYLTNRSIEAR